MRHPLINAAVVGCEWCADGRIVWCVTTSNKRIPVEPEPHPDGNISVSWVGGAPHATVHAVSRNQTSIFDLGDNPKPAGGDEYRYMPHHVRCHGSAEEEITPTIVE